MEMSLNQNQVEPIGKKDVDCAAESSRLVQYITRVSLSSRIHEATKALFSRNHSNIDGFLKTLDAIGTEFKNAEKYLAELEETVVSEACKFIIHTNHGQLKFMEYDFLASKINFINNFEIMKTYKNGAIDTDFAGNMGYCELEFQRREENWKGNLNYFLGNAIKVLQYCYGWDEDKIAYAMHLSVNIVKERFAENKNEHWKHPEYIVRHETFA